MKTLPPGPAFAFARACAGLTTTQVSKQRSRVTRIERNYHGTSLNLYMALLAKTGAKLIVQTRTGEQVELVAEQEQP